MSWKPDNFSDYSFAEYPQPPKSAGVDYTDPRFYQPHSGDADTSHAVSTASISQPQEQPFPGYGETQIREYRGPASLEHYTTDAGAEQRRAAEQGSADGADQRKERLAGLGGLGAALAVMAKFGLASITALVSVAAYSLIFGWPFAVGLVALLFIHEMGHAVVMKLKGLPVGGMIFIPLLGAAVFMNRMPRNAKDEAEVGISGPVAGALASLVCLLIALSSPTSPGIWASLAYFGFFLNLFNLIPIVPFDGGRVMAAIDRRVWLLGFIALVAIQVWEWVNGSSQMWLLIFIFMGATQFWTRRKVANTPEGKTYYTVPVSERIIIGLAYFSLAIVLVLGMTAAHGLMGFAQ